MKTEVYSWRVSAEIKSDLEREARLRKTSVASLVDLAVRTWLKKRAGSLDENEEQVRLHHAATTYLGMIDGRDARRSQKASELVRARVKRRHGR